MRQGSTHPTCSHCACMMPISNYVHGLCIAHKWYRDRISRDRGYTVAVTSRQMIYRGHFPASCKA